MADILQDNRTGFTWVKRIRDMLDGTWAEVVALGAGEAHVGQVGGTTPRVVAASYAKQADATQYTSGDIISNDKTTAANVIPIEFTVGRSGAAIVSGRASGCRCVVTAASGTNLVLPGFDLLLFRPNTNIPYAAGSYPLDNAVMNISAAQYKELVGVLSFPSTGWRNQLGAATAAGLVAYQAVSFATRPFAPFNLADIAGATKLLGVMQDTSGWNPGNVAYTFDFVLDVDVD